MVNVQTHLQHTKRIGGTRPVHVLAFCKINALWFYLKMNIIRSRKYHQDVICGNVAFQG